LETFGILEKWSLRRRDRRDLRFDCISNKRNLVKDPNWQEADQLAIQSQSVTKALNPGRTSGLQHQRPKPLGEPASTLPSNAGNAASTRCHQKQFYDNCRNSRARIG